MGKGSAKDGDFLPRAPGEGHVYFSDGEDEDEKKKKKKKDGGGSANEEWVKRETSGDALEPRILRAPVYLSLNLCRQCL